MPDRLLSTTQAADLLQISRRQIHRYITSGRLTAERLPCGWAVRESDLRRLQRQPVGRPSGKNPPL